MVFGKCPKCGGTVKQINDSVFCADCGLTGGEFQQFGGIIYEPCIGCRWKNECVGRCTDLRRWLAMHNI